MKINKTLAAIVLTLSFLVAPLAGRADDKKDEKAKPYPLDKCIVSDEKLGEMGKPYVFTHNGQEIKLCCKSCLKDFNKNKAKYMAKIEEAQKKSK